MQKFVHSLKSSITMLYCALHNPEVPWYVKLMLFLVIVYVISPVDLIPDFIPVLGVMDEIILVPLLVGCMIRLVPENVQQQGTNTITTANAFRLKSAGMLLVFLIWAGIAVACYVVWRQLL